MIGMEIEMLWNWILLLVMAILVLDVWMRRGDDRDGWRWRGDDHDGWRWHGDDHDGWR